MSHWTTVKTQFTDENCLIEALKELFPGNEVVKKSIVRGHAGATQKVDVVMKDKRSGHSQYDVGFQKQKDGTYNQVTDWWGAKHWAGNESEFSQRLTQVYSKVATKKQARKFGWGVQEKVKEDGTIKLTLTKY